MNRLDSDSDNTQTRTVGWIIGTPYSGSSLLNVLLDGQPGVRGLGEAIHLVAPHGNPFCTECGKTVHECALRPAVEPDRFYGSIFDFYADCRVLIDSTKAWDLSTKGHPVEAGIDYRLLLLSKTPHEFAFSKAGHQSDANISESFTDWIGVYKPVLRLAMQHDLLGPDRVCPVSYGALAETSLDTVDRLCQFLGTEFSQDQFSRWWESDSHIIGGNNAVHNQVAGSEWFEDTAPEYLGGKYEGKRHIIFRDRAWTKDAKFIAECRGHYLRLKEDLEPLLSRLGHPSFDEVQDELAHYEAESAASL